MIVGVVIDKMKMGSVTYLFLGPKYNLNLFGLS